MIIDNVILFISIVNFILTLFVFLNAKESKQHISYVVASFIVTAWMFSVFVFRAHNSWFFESLSYGLGILVATSGLLWVYNLIEEKIPKFIWYFIIPLSTAVFFISSFTVYVQSSFGKLGPFGYTGEKGILFNEYTVYLGLLIFMCLYKLGQKALWETNIIKSKQISSIFLGFLIFTLTAFLFSFLIPLVFNRFEFTDLSAVTYLPLLLFIFYSILRHRLFGIKIILTQLLVVIFLSLLLLNFLFSRSLNEYMWSGSLLATSSFLSYLIVRSMFTEIKLGEKLLEETQKNLNLEKELSKKLVNISGQAIRKLESELKK